MTSTNLGAGMKAGLEVLGFNIYNESNALGITCNGSSCAQGSEAKPIMLLNTDGIPNQTPNGPCQTDGPSWPGELVNSQPADLNCPLYFAQKAAEAGVQVYVIGLGYAIDETYLQEVARTGNGQYYFIADGADLNTVLEALFPPIDNEQTPP
jgi:hypothetical protein